MPVYSFSFRLACYEQFHWTPETIANLTVMEAERLAIYFEETGTYHHKLRREQERQSGNSSPSSSKDVVVESGWDEDEDDEEED